MEADRRWFKYMFGFINIDSENLYLTKTGNWSEITNLKEKNSKGKSSNSQGFSSVSFILFLLGTMVVHAYNYWFLDSFSKIVFIYPFAIFLMYISRKSDLGANFVIPLSKIETVTQEDNLLIIDFFDAENHSQIEKLRNVDRSGVEFLRSIKS